MRRDAMKAVDALEKKGDLGEDEAKALSDTVQELTDDYIKQVARLALWQVLCVCLLQAANLADSGYRMVCKHIDSMFIVTQLPAIMQCARTEVAAA